MDDPDGCECGTCVCVLRGKGRRTSVSQSGARSESDPRVGLTKMKDEAHVFSMHVFWFDALTSAVIIAGGASSNAVVSSHVSTDVACDCGKQNIEHRTSSNPNSTHRWAQIVRESFRGSTRASLSNPAPRSQKLTVADVMMPALVQFILAQLWLMITLPTY